MADKDIKPSEVLGIQKQRPWPSRQKVEVLGRERGDAYVHSYVVTWECELLQCFGKCGT